MRFEEKRIAVAERVGRAKVSGPHHLRDAGMSRVLAGKIALQLAGHLVDLGLIHAVL